MQFVTTPHPIDDAALRQIFLDARTHNKWQPKDVPDELLKDIVDVLKFGPTSANCSACRSDAALAPLRVDEKAKILT